MDLRNMIYVPILLVLCFTMAVSADPQQFLDTLHKKYVGQTSETMDSLLSTVVDEINAAKKKKLNPAGCQDDFADSMKTVIDPRLAKMTDCYTKNTNYESAETCYKHNLTELKKEAHKLHVAVTSCIHVKCAAKYFPNKCK